MSRNDRVRALKLGLAPHRAALALTAGRYAKDITRGGVGSPLRLTTIPRPERRAGWVRVAPTLAGICASDRKMLHLDGMGTTLLALYGLERRGIVLGHEVVGTVIEADAASGHQEGDRVVLEPLLSCSDKGLPRCAACERGDDHICEGIAESGELHQGQGFGFNARYGGGWADELVAPGHRAFRVPEVLTDRDAVLAEPMGIAVHAVARSLPAPGERALVIGPGAIGLCLLHALATLRPGLDVTAAGVSPASQPWVAQAGGDALLLGSRRTLVQAAGEHLATTVRGNRLTGPVLDHGFDVVFDAVGSPQTLDDAFRMCRPGGTVVVVGTSTKQKVDWSLVWARELTVRGTVNYGDDVVPDDAAIPAGTRRALAIALEVLVERHPGSLVTHVFGLDDPVRALRTADGGPAVGAVKVAFDPTLPPDPSA